MVPHTYSRAPAPLANGNSYICARQPVCVWGKINYCSDKCSTPYFISLINGADAALQPEILPSALSALKGLNQNEKRVDFNYNVSAIERGVSLFRLTLLITPLCVLISGIRHSVALSENGIRFMAW